MTDYTFATVAVTAADQAAAQAEFPAYFLAGASPTGAPPATHYVTSGPFDNDELAAIQASTTFTAHGVLGEDVAAGLAQLGLVLVTETA